MNKQKAREALEKALEMSEDHMKAGYDTILVKATHAALQFALDSLGEDDGMTQEYVPYKSTYNTVKAQQLYDGNREPLSPKEMKAIRRSLKLTAHYTPALDKLIKEVGGE